MFIAATPESELRNKMQEAINRKGGKIKVIEKSGTKIVRMLQRNDPFKTKECENQECLICKGEKPGGCRESGKYTGQTSHNGFTRGGKHIEECRLKKTEMRYGNTVPMSMEKKSKISA